MILISDNYDFCGHFRISDQPVEELFVGDLQVKQEIFSPTKETVVQNYSHTSSPKSLDDRSQDESYEEEQQQIETNVIEVKPDMNLSNSDPLAQETETGEMVATPQAEATNTANSRICRICFETVKLSDFGSHPCNNFTSSQQKRKSPVSLRVYQDVIITAPLSPTFSDCETEAQPEVSKKSRKAGYDDDPDLILHHGSSSGLEFYEPYDPSAIEVDYNEDETGKRDTSENVQQQF